MILSVLIKWSHSFKAMSNQERLAQKNASLKILYDVASCINQSSDLNDLLTRFLRILKEMTNANAILVYLCHEDQAQLVGNAGFPSEYLAQVQPYLMREHWYKQEILCRSIKKTGLEAIQSMLAMDATEILAVPLQHKDKILGIYYLFLPPPGLCQQEDMLEILVTIGKHLGMAVAKAKLDQESQRLSLMEERNTMAHEVHDSLAQTLASLRFQTQVLDDMLNQQQYDNAKREVAQIKNSLEEANTELRELLAHFRAPLNKRGLIPAIKDLITQFQQHSGMLCFFQPECYHPGLPATMEMQVIRIIQESLANVYKHSQAHTVRVLLRSNEQGQYSLLVEDDGKGFDFACSDDNLGQHIGLSIMQERAKRLGGQLQIDSEIDEGTRVELSFNHT